MPELMRLGEVAAKLGENTRQIQRIVDEGLAPRPKKKGQYEPWAIARGLIRYYRDKSGKVSEARTIDAARIASAEAETAEITLAEKKGLLMLKKDARLIWADLTIECRKLIVSKENWNSKALLLQLSKIKPTV